jgi:hypothetical protein
MIQAGCSPPKNGWIVGNYHIWSFAPNQAGNIATEFKCGLHYHPDSENDFFTPSVCAALRSSASQFRQALMVMSVRRCLSPLVAGQDDVRAFSRPTRKGRATKIRIIRMGKMPITLSLFSCAVSAILSQDDYDDQPSYSSLCVGS